MISIAFLVVGLLTVQVFGAQIGHQQVNSAAGCLICKETFTLLDDVLNGNVTVDEAATLAIDFCRWNGGGAGYHCQGDWQCLDMCKGAVDEFDHEFLEIGTRKFLDPNTDCTRFGYCGAEATHTMPAGNFLAPNPSRRVAQGSHLPPLSPATTTKNTGVIRILQVTDIHHDPEYAAGTWTQCGQPMCCRDVPYSDMVLNKTNIAGTYGDYNCDAPLVLMETLMDAMSGVYPPPDFGFLTGDDPPHNVWNQTREYNVNVSYILMDMIQKALPNTTFFPALGNHNGFPVNQYNIDPTLDQDWLYYPLARLYTPWLDENALQTFVQGGFYVARINEYLQVIVLNSNFHNNENYWLFLDEGDIAGMMSWFEEILAELRASNQRAYFLQHHPLESCFSNYSTYLSNLITSYDDVIIAAFFGHTHDDQFYVFNKGTFADPIPSIVGYIPGAGTPGSQNPSFRIYDVNATTGEILEFYHYRADLDKQGLINNNSTDAPKPVWNLVYTASQAYNLPSLSATSWYNAATSMFTNDTLFQFYFDTFTPGTMGGAYTPTQRLNMICNIIGATPAGVDYCNENPPSAKHIQL